MKINDQGFTERLSNAPTRTGGASDAAQSSSSTGKAGGYSSSDTLQLSSFASQLQKVSSSDSDRSARLSQISQAVQSGTFKVNPAVISSAMVSESIQSAAR